MWNTQMAGKRSETAFSFVTFWEAKKTSLKERQLVVYNTIFRWEGISLQYFTGHESRHESRHG